MKKIFIGWGKSRQLIKNEITAGLTAFWAISYIIVVNPLILADAGIPIDLSVFATIFTSVIGCAVMGIWADAPIILVPGMGVNAFFTYTVVMDMGFTWQEALGIAFIAGILFLLVACTCLADILIRAVSPSLKYGITAGIGLFLIELGLEKGQLIEQGKNSLIKLASLQNPAALLTILGLILSLVLYLRRVNGGFFIAIILISIVGNVIGVGKDVSLNVNLDKILLYRNMFFQNSFIHILDFKFWLAAFSMAMILIFDTVGILEGLLPDKTKFKKTFSGSAAVTVVASIMGTSPTVVAAESGAGIISGGTNGIMALTAAVLFMLVLFFVPFLSYIPQSAVAPVIIITGTMMLQQLRYADFSDFSEWFPAVLLTVMIPFSGSISTGLAFGFIVYPIMKLCTSKTNHIHPLMYAVAILFLVDLFVNNY
ncbi:NCS2 family permease [Pectinatus sottacetonis]|uniref:NCS2 family permease n=1 Tax=Pectinatus sottacetonis TaxID=1002795 RepID=UPI0018C4D727